MSKMPTSWNSFDHEFGHMTKPVFVSGDGPPIIIIHELPGMIVQCVEFAERVREQGYTVYLPLLFGKPNQKLGHPISWIQYPVMMCIRRELYAFKKNTTSPIMDWLRNLSQSVNDKHQTNRVGAIGMCLTGSFVVPMMLDEFMVAPVMSQPAFPASGRNFGFDQAVLETAKERCEAGIEIKAYRFKEDKLSTPSKIKAFKRVFGDALLYEELDCEYQHQNKLGCHSVFTGDYSDETNSPTRIAFNDLMQFFDLKLKPV